MTERYSTPAKGTLDWHNPLNENFNKLDRDVEIRDLNNNRGNYTPAEGAKFLATDTGDVYIGDGSNWNNIGSVASTDTSSSTGSLNDGSVVAAPGDVQAAMDANTPGQRWGAQRTQTVRLVSGTTYEPDETLRVPSGVRLDCNGAVIRPTGDFDVMEIERSAEVHEPRIDVRNISFSSTAIVIGADGGGKTETPNPATVYEARLYNTEKSGIGLQFRGGDQPCSMQKASGKIRNFEYGVHFRGGQSQWEGWCNGNRFSGDVNGSRIPIYMDAQGEAEVSGNMVRAQLQASDKTDWIIRQEDAPDAFFVRGNTYMIYSWDTFNMENQYKDSSNRNPQRSPVWYIGEGEQEQNTMYAFDGASNEHILNNSTGNADNNVVFNALPDPTGVIDDAHPPQYQVEDSPYHPDGDN